MNQIIDYLGICQLLKSLRSIGFSENEIKKIARRIALGFGVSFTLYPTKNTEEIDPAKQKINQTSVDKAEL